LRAGPPRSFIVSAREVVAPREQRQYFEAPL